MDILLTIPFAIPASSFDPLERVTVPRVIIALKDLTTIAFGLGRVWEKEIINFSFCL